MAPTTPSGGETREQIRVVLADDHAPLRSALRADLEAEGFVVCAAVGDAASAVEAATVERPDVCLLDLYMPGNALVAAWRITEALPATAVAVLTVSVEEPNMVAAIRAGALAYMLKDAEPEQLAATLRCLAAGGVHFLPAPLARLAAEGADGAEEALSALLELRASAGGAAAPAGPSRRELACRVRSLVGRLRAADEAELPELRR